MFQKKRVTVENNVFYFLLEVLDFKKSNMTLKYVRLSNIQTKVTFVCFKEQQGYQKSSLRLYTPFPSV